MDKEEGRTGQERRGEKGRLGGFSLFLPNQLSISVSHVNPPIFCLRIPNGAQGRIMFITSHSEEKCSL